METLKGMADQLEVGEKRSLRIKVFRTWSLRGTIERSNFQSVPNELESARKRDKDISGAYYSDSASLKLRLS